MNLTIWCLIIGGLLLAYGLLASAWPDLAAKGLVAFPRNRVCAWVLCAAGWFGAAYELDTIGIDVFDKFLKAFPGELWILAIVLTPLTCWWMENLLAVRGASAVLMLFPCELFPYTRVAESDWRLVLVGFAYVCAVIGMFAMFYPWRARQVLAWVAASRLRVMASGVFLGVLGAFVSVLGVTVLK